MRRKEIAVKRVMAAALFWTACADAPAVQPTQIDVSGYKLRADCWQAAQKEIRTVAAFEMQCADNQLELVVLNTNRFVNGTFCASQVGVSGCGKRLTYIPHGGNWVSSLAIK